MTLLVLEEAGCAFSSFAFGSLANIDQGFDEEVKKNHGKDAPCIGNEAGLLVFMSGTDYNGLGLDCSRECIMCSSHRKLLVISLHDLFVLARYLSQP